MEPMYRMAKTPQAAPPAPQGAAPAKGNPAAQVLKAARLVEAAAKTAAETATKASGRRIQVRQSGVHGKGVFALQDIPAGMRLIEYTGERIDWDEAMERHPHDPADPNHTFYFSLDDGRVIDANVGGNASRWINHACDPNCQADEAEGRVFIEALRDLHAGEELFYDYGLVIDERYTPKLKKEYECRCGAPNCRHTMLAPKRR